MTPTRRTVATLAALCSVTTSVVVACGSDDARGYAVTPGATEPGPLGPSGSLGGGDAGAGGGNGDPACAAQVTTAKRAEVDVVFVIDTSGSMNEETAQVQQNINTFASTIGGSGLDYRVVMIAEKPRQLPIPLPIPPAGICVPPPLGGPSCSNNPPTFHHLEEDVGSSDSLQILLDELPSYQGWLRPTAYKVFIEVTDDNSALPFDQFDAQLLAKPGGLFGTAAQRRYIFNAICGWKRNTPVLSAQKCGSAENTGDQYQNLAQLTGGVVDSVCETDYSSVLGNIAKGLVTRLGCEFALPVPADGSATDPTKVVVNYTPGSGGATVALTQVTDASKCGSVGDGWYFDDDANPTKVVFCTTTCSTVGADTAGKLDVAVGCKAPPPK